MRIVAIDQNDLFFFFIKNTRASTKEREYIAGRKTQTDLAHSASKTRKPAYSCNAKIFTKATKANIKLHFKSLKINTSGDWINNFIIDQQCIKFSQL